MIHQNYYKHKKKIFKFQVILKHILPYYLLIRPIFNTVLYYVMPDNYVFNTDTHTALPQAFKI